MAWASSLRRGTVLRLVRRERGAAWTQPRTLRLGDVEIRKLRTAMDGTGKATVAWSNARGAWSGVRSVSRQSGEARGPAAALGPRGLGALVWALRRPAGPTGVVQARVLPR